jgi:2-oxoglutarate dehydrogenase E2 component (dihydrolipoamide succinyltransferase)
MPEVKCPRLSLMSNIGVGLPAKIRTMSQIELLLPKMGESVAEATIIKWLKNEGDTVKADEPIIEIATDKVDSEVPAPEDGILVKHLVQANEVVQVGKPIALIATGNAAATPPVQAAPVAAPAPASAEVPFVPTPASSAGPVARTGSSGRFYSPLVRTIAETEGVSMAELESIAGRGQGGRVTKDDLLDYLKNRKAASIPQPAAPVAHAPAPSTPVSAAAPKKSAITIGASDEIIEMDRMRKLIAEHMVMSKHTSAHVTSYVEADVTNLVIWREKIKKTFEAKEKTKLTFTPIFIEAVARAIRDFPMINISVDGDRIIKRGEINIGMAAALPSGNLIVPVIRNADQLNLVGLARKVNDLADRARNNKLQPDEIQGGTYTLTNVGTFGNVMGTPVINQPQVAIMATGAIRKRPAVIETPQGDLIGVRHMMFLSHSYDHRVVDGGLGGTFVRRVADYLENFDINREI